MVFSSYSPLVLRWCLPPRHGVFTEPMAGFDSAGLSAIGSKLGCTLLLADQTIADAGLSGEQFRLRGVGLQFLPQVSQIDAQVVGLLDIVRPPNLAENLTVCEHFPGMLDKESQERVFSGGQLHL